jgi:non-ribosomal peptide synthetase component F
MAMDRCTSKFDITFELTETERGVEGVIEYSKDIFDDQTILRWGAFFGDVLGRIAADPTALLSELVQPSAAECDSLKLLGQGPRLDVDDGAIVDVFDRIAAEHSGRAAVLFRDDSLTYGEFRDESIRIAGALQARGVVKGDRVAVNLPNSLELIPTLFGILRAGATYVPVQHDGPEHRLDTLRIRP